MSRHGIEGTILRRLKEETQRLHSQLESRLNLEHRLHSADAYCQLLGAFFGFYKPLEESLMRLQDQSFLGLDISERRKVGWLQQDLKQLGVAADLLPCCDDLPSVVSTADCLGCLYVVEGATLGGQIIKRMLREHLSITPKSGGAFFASYGDRVGQMWLQFGKAVSDYAAIHPTSQDAIVASAQETFEKLDRWFAQTLEASNSICQTGNDGQ